MLAAGMSRENVEAIRAAYAAFNRGDIEAVLELVAPDAEWYPATLPVMGLDAIRGRDAVEEFFNSEIVPGLERFEPTPLEMEDLGEHVLVKTAYRGRVAGTELEQILYALFTFRSGKGVRMCDYAERARALEAAGAAG
jgi:ketosteroid isomerase-like protein